MVVEELIIQDQTVRMIKDVGFPIASFVIMVSILIYVMKKEEKRQEKTEARYEKLVDKFIETTKNVSEQNNTSIKDITAELKNMTAELKVVGAKIDNYARIIDEEFEAKSPLYIFERQ